MEFFFADDSTQNKPSRAGMGPLVAIGGFHVPDEHVQGLERDLESVCQKFGFPKGERFKWSPSPHLWMAKNLQGEDRARFFQQILGVPPAHKTVAFVLVADDKCLPATDSRSSQQDVFRMFLERVELRLQAQGKQGVVIVDRPGGDRNDEGKFLGDCADMLKAGTDYVQHKQLALNVLTSSSQQIRSLQLADLITSCTLARVSGEKRYAPPIFEFVKPLLNRRGDRVQGYGLKLHPDFKYTNLYHWIVGDQHYWRGLQGLPMPVATRNYRVDEWTP